MSAFFEKNISKISANLSQIDKCKGDIVNSIRSIKEVFLGEDKVLDDLIQPGSYLGRIKAFNALHNGGFSPKTLDVNNDRDLTELKFWCNISDIIESQKNDIVETMNDLHDLKMSIIPVVPIMNLFELARKSGETFAWTNMFNCVVDISSCKGYLQEFKDYISDMLRYHKPKQEYIAMFVNSNDDDSSSKKKLLKYGFQEMDVHTAIYIYKTLDLFLPHIHLASFDPDRPDCLFVMDWISGKHNDEVYNNPTIKIYNGLNIPKKERKSKFVKIFRK